MIKTLDGNKKNFLISLSKNLAKRKSLQLSKTSSVQKIINNVKSKNIKAVLLYEKKFNKIKKIKISNIKFSKKEITQIVRKLNKKTKKSIDLAYSRIKKFHQKQKFHSFKYLDKYNNKLMYNYLQFHRYMHVKSSMVAIFHNALLDLAFHLSSF